MRHRDPLHEAVYSAAMAAVRCPRCGADGGAKCRKPNGRTIPIPHEVRMQEFSSVLAAIKEDRGGIE